MTDLTGGQTREREGSKEKGKCSVIKNYKSFILPSTSAHKAKSKLTILVYKDPT